MRLTVMLGLLAIVCGCAATPKPDANRPERTRGQVMEPSGGTTSVGQDIYDTNCSSCHRLGRYDTEGRMDLARHAGRIKSDFLGGHHGESLPTEQVDQLNAFIQSP